MEQQLLMFSSKMELLSIIRHCCFFFSFANEIILLDKSAQISACPMERKLSMQQANTWCQVVYFKTKQKNKDLSFHSSRWNRYTYAFRVAFYGHTIYRWFFNGHSSCTCRWHDNNKYVYLFRNALLSHYYRMKNCRRNNFDWFVVILR